MELGARVDDLSGKRFGRLVVTSFAGKTKDKKSLWLCKCDCGNEKVARAAALVSGKTRSCGCLYYESRKVVSEKLSENKSPLYKHGLCYSRINGIYRNIKGRCYRKSDPAYTKYGGRGIKLCDEWENDFMAFYNWSMNNGYAENMTIDRIDNDGDYEPDNCRWVDQKTQQNNRSNNVRIEYNGETHTLSEWAGVIGVSKPTIYHRYERKWDTARMLNYYSV